MYGLCISLACWSINVLTQIFICQLQTTGVMQGYAHLHLPFCSVKIECPAKLYGATETTKTTIIL